MPFFQKVLHYFKPSYVKSLSRPKQIRYGIIVFLILLAIFRLFAPNTPISNPARIQAVKLATIAELQNGSATVSAIGEVESLQQVELRAQVSERVAAINVSIGETVVPGQILIRLENDTLIASRDQATANVAVANARLAEVERGARPQEIRIQETTVANAKTSRNEAVRSLQSSLESAFTTADDAVQNRVDQLFVDGEVDFPELVFFSGNAQLEIDVKNQRFLLGNTLDAWSEEMITEGNLLDQSAIVRDRLSLLKAFLNDVAKAVNDLTPTSANPQTTIDGWQAAILLARTSVDTSLSGILASEEKLKNSESNLQLVEGQLDLLKEGSAEEQVASARASLAAARAQLALANAQLSRTVIRSPINGKVSSISARSGALLNPGERIVSIVNPAGLQVRTFINSRDRGLVVEGADVLIENQLPGIVSRIAPSIDTVTKKVEVIVAISENNIGLLPGEFANIKIAIQEEKRDTVFLVPLEAIKITNNGAGVYILTGNNLVDILPVELGRVIGNAIEVTGGLEITTEIITNIRGIDIGEEVTIEN